MLAPWAVKPKVPVPEAKDEVVRKINAVCAALGVAFACDIYLLEFESVFLDTSVTILQSEGIADDPQSGFRFPFSRPG